MTRQAMKDADGERYEGGEAQPAPVETPDEFQRFLRRGNGRLLQCPRNRQLFAPFLAREQAALELLPIGIGQPPCGVVVGQVVPCQLHPLSSSESRK